MKNQKEDLSRKDQTGKAGSTAPKTGEKSTTSKTSANLKDNKDLGTKRDERGSSLDDNRKGGSSQKGW